MLEKFVLGYALDGLTPSCLQNQEKKKKRELEKRNKLVLFNIVAKIIFLNREKKSKYG